MHTVSDLLSSLAGLLDSGSTFDTYFKFPLELLAAIWIYTFWAKRRPRWPLRMCAALTILFLCSLAWPAGWTGPIEMVKYVSLFLVSVAGIYLVVDCDFGEAMYRGIAAYTTQHLAYSFLSLLSYGRLSLWPGGRFVCYLCVYVLTYVLVYFLFAKRMRREDFYRANDPVFVAFLSIMLVLVVVLNYLRVYYVSWDRDRTGIAHTLFSLYAIVGCAFSLFIQAGFHRQSHMAQQLEIANQLIYKQEKQYHLSEETINIINLKCHDLKHQVAALRRSMDDPASRKALEGIESATQIYDCVVKTGNPALDVILTEKSLLCESRNIQLTCMVDAGGLDAVSETDLYAIFGNLLDNAIESVMELPDPGRRVISLTVATAGNVLVIHTENYFNHPVRLENGIPITTKADIRYHGFGMKSLQLLAGRYGGTLSVEPDGDIFHVNIMLPMHGEGIENTGASG